MSLSYSETDIRVNLERIAIIFHHTTPLPVDTSTVATVNRRLQISMALVKVVCPLAALEDLHSNRNNDLPNSAVITKWIVSVRDKVFLQNVPRFAHSVAEAGGGVIHAYVLRVLTTAVARDFVPHGVALT